MPQLAKIMDENQNPIELVESDSDPDIDLDAAELEDTLVVAVLARLDGVIPRVEVHSPQQQQVISTVSTGLRWLKLDFLFICVICVKDFSVTSSHHCIPFIFRLW